MGDVRADQADDIDAAGQEAVTVVSLGLRLASGRSMGSMGQSAGQRLENENVAILRIRPYPLFTALEFPR